MSNRHGGKRTNAGRLPNNQSHGRPVSRGGLTSFGFTGRSREHNAFPNEDNQEQPPLENNQETNTEQPPLENNQDAENIENEDSDPYLYDESGAEAMEDILEAAGESSLHGKRGKNVKDCALFAKQKEDIKKLYKKYEELAYKGHYWIHPPQRVTKKIDLKTCWKEHFLLPVFNFFPSVFYGNNWLKCKHCGSNCTKNGKNFEARLVFGAFSNYWLNAPERYACTNCNKSYNGANEEILAQAFARDPELEPIFPCVLTKKNAIDKKLLDIVIHSAVKGIGPAAMSENLVSWHEETWNKKENEWLSFIKRSESSVMYAHDQTKREDIEKCPPYFSDELGGCVPSGKWLVTIFCLTVEKLHDYYDSECIKRLFSSVILSIDASYKVPKWIMRWGGQKIYECLHSGMNEYGEVIVNRFSTSDNHAELGSNLSQLNELGLNPTLVFSDNPKRDQSLMRTTFSNIASNMKDDISTNVTALLEEADTNMQLVKARGEIIYCHEINKTLAAIDTLIDDIESNESEEDCLLSFDAGKFSDNLLFSLNVSFLTTKIFSL